MPEIRKVRKRGEKKVLTDTVVQEEEPKPIVASQEETDSEESQKRLPKANITQSQGNFTTIKGINEISAELTDDRRSELVESNYWDETHNWGSDNEAVSDDYWHFVGRYE